MSEDRNSVIKSLIALLSSAKATRLADVDHDYYSVEGVRIPYRKFGYSSLEEFFHSVSEFVITKKHNDLYVETRGASKSAHINELVSEQKSSKRSKLSSRSKNRGNQRMTRSMSSFRYDKKPSAYQPLMKKPTYFSQPPKKAPTSQIRSDQPKERMKPFLNVDYNKNFSSQEPSRPAPSFNSKSNEVEKPVSSFPSVTRDIQPFPVSLPQAHPVNPAPPPPAPRAQEIAWPKAPPKKDLPSPSEPLRTLSNDLAPALDKISSQSKVKPKTTAVVPVGPNDLEGFDPDSPVIRLLELLRKRRCRPPEFDILIQKNWTQNKLKPFLCTVVVYWINAPEENKLEPTSCIRFTTYPNEFFDRTDGLNAVSEIALEDLLSRSALLPQTTFPEVVLSRISELVAGNQHGIWVHSVKGLYENKFKESLPGNWLDLVADSKRFIVENLIQTYWVIKPAIIASDETLHRSPAPIPCSVPPLVLPKSNTWDVHVVSLSPFNSVIVRLLGKDYSDALVALSLKMDTYYNAAPLDHIPQCVTNDRYYACRDEAGDTDWSRVQVTHVERTTALVHFIDHGEMLTVEVEALRELHPDFAALPGQSVKCYLEGLEGCDFEGYDTYFERCEAIARSIVGESLVAVVESRELSSVTLYNSGSVNDPSMNDEIKKGLILSLQPPSLDPVALFEAFVVNVDENGAVFLQTPSFAQSFLGEKLRKVDDLEYKFITTKNPRDVHSSHVYFIFRNNCHSRVKVIDVDPVLKTADVELLDLGGTCTVQVDQLLFVPELQNVLRLIPPQVTQVALHDVRQTQTRKVATFFQKMAPCPVEALVKVVDINGPLPVVSLFVRVGVNNSLVSVSESLQAYCSDDLNSIDEIEDNHSIDEDLLDKVTNKNVPDQISILPQIDELFPIYVTDFVNPHVFTVLPTNRCTDLNELTQKMTDYYNSTPPHDINLPADHLCAVFDPTYNFWFRARVIKYVDNQCCSRLLDYLNVIISNPGNVRPLVDRFKYLPPLAFPASIHGISPLDKDWDANDCIQFSKRVSNKKFMSTIKKMWRNEQTGGINLVLVIFDTTTDEDVDLADILVRSGIGRFSD